MEETATQDESDQWPIKIFSHSAWIKFFNVMWRLGPWFSGRHGSVRLMVGLDGLKGLCQPKLFYDSVFCI